MRLKYAPRADLLERKAAAASRKGNLRHNKRLTRLNLRGREKVNAQWHLYCMVHNIEKLANSGWRQ